MTQFHPYQSDSVVAVVWWLEEIARNQKDLGSIPAASKLFLENMAL